MGGRVARTLLAAVLTVAAGILVAVPTAQAGSDRPDGYATVVADRAADALTGATGLSTAQAMQRLASQPARQALGERLVAELGASAAGFWLDQKADAVVVNVVDQLAAAAVRRAGATARIVPRSTAALESIRTQLTATQPADTAVGVDVAANQVVVQIGAKAPRGAALSTLVDTAGNLGPAVRIEEIKGSFSTLIEGGYPIVGSGGGRCSLGFNTTGSTAVTAGHCTQGIPQWWEGCCGNGYFGPSVAVNFPGDDFGLIRNDGGLAQNGWVYLYNGQFQDIVTAANPYYGLSICKSGSTSGLTCGTVYNTNVTICYPQGCVGGLAQSNTYAAPGDSGGSWFTGGYAVGLTSGGGGGWTYFQPVVEALQRYGVWVF
jgi:streptogrisin D